MKKITTTLLTGCISISACAQSYDALWKKVQTNSSKDRPKSALASVEQIRLKAVAEKNDAQLLRASLMNLVFSVEISPDSLTTCIAAMEESLANETRPVVQALWHSALAKAYRTHAWKSGVDHTDMTTKSVAHAEASLSNPEALAEARISDYLPLFVEKDDSRFFNNDLLHVLFNTYTNCVDDEEKVRAMRHRVVEVYRRIHADNAVVRLTLDELRGSHRAYEVKGAIENDEYFRALSTLHQTYAEAELAPCVVEKMTELHRAYSSDDAFATHNDSLLIALAEKAIDRYGKNEYANSLRNFVDLMSQPRAVLSNLPDCIVPQAKATLHLKSRHTERIALRLTRIADDDMKSELRGKDLAKLAKANRKQATLTTYKVDPAPHYVWSERDVELQIPDQAGIYVAELLVKGRTVSTSLLHVSALQAMVFAYPDGKNRVVAVDIRTGRPVSGAKVSLYVRSKQTGNYSQAKVYNCGKNGAVTISGKKRNGFFYVWTDEDRAAENFSISDLEYYGANEQNTRTTVDLFTDRPIYRPGQKVEVSGIAYTRTADEMHTEKAFRAKLTLYSANYKELDSLLVETDDYGMFSGSFTLPKTVMPGTFRLQLKGGSVDTSMSFSVEEYKRPTFTATTSPVTTAYALGDTVKVEGKAETYTGVAVAGAKVNYTIVRNVWLRYGRSDNNRSVHGVTTTDSEGHFSIPVTLTGNDEKNGKPRWARYFYTVDYTVTAANGETASGSFSLQTATRRSWIEHDVPQLICRESGKEIAPFHVRQVNASGQELEGKGCYSIINASGEEVTNGTFVTSAPLKIDALGALPEGVYSLTLLAEGAEEADTACFALFSEETKSPVDKSQSLFAFDRYADKRDSVHVMVGSPHKGVTLFVDELAEGKLLRSKRYELSDSVIHFDYAYRPEYGDGLTVYYAFVHDGRLFTHRVFVEKPIPEKKLNLSWQTFRSRLQPGQDETWTLRVTNPDGSPANSQVMAVLYDASLDALSSPLTWNFSNVGFYRSGTRASWSWQRPFCDAVLHYYKNLKLRKNYSANDFTTWISKLFIYREPKVSDSYILYSRTNARKSEMRPSPSAALFSAEPMDFDASDDRMENGEELSAMANAPALGSSASAPKALVLRKNFAETAFFRPNLHTDADGVATISFALPESTTQWNFKALAHTTAMDYGTLDATVIARKDFMVQPAMPRFVREGDVTTLPVQLTNLSSDAISATVNVEFRDALTDKVVYTKKQTVSLSSGEVKVVPFTYTVKTDAAMLVCRTTATDKNFSDGEEHYLPVLSNHVEVTRTLPFSLTEKGTRTWQVDTLFNAASAQHRRLTVELTSNPTWTAVSALPALAADGSSCMSATEWATRLYALCLGQHIAKNNPAIAEAVANHPEEVDALSRLNLNEFTELTPWLQDARREKQRIASLRNLFNEERAAADMSIAWDKLSSLRTNENGWSWYHGMPTNRYTTVDVCILLARIKKLTGENPGPTGTILFMALVDYLENEIASDVKAMKRTESDEKRKLTPSEFQLRYLYLRTLLGDGANDADSRFLLDRAALLSKDYTMYGKALTAIVLAENDRKEEAKDFVESLLEHTVTTDEMGRYFDTQRAEWSWQSYRIPTQCAAIEAMNYFGNRAEANDMRLWLMQSKRTQMWETSRATADAVYALLSTSDSLDQSTVTPLTATKPVYYTLLNGKQIVGFNAKSESTTPTTAAHFRHSYTDKAATEATSLKVRKESDGLTWGAVYATFDVPATEVQTEGKGLKLTQQFLVVPDDAEVIEDCKVLDESTVLKKGDEVLVKYTIVADRDYDFVQLSAPRPACLEPKDALSGCFYYNGLCIYRAVHDASTDYFIEQVKKGRHTFYDVLRVDRSGTYSSGIATLQSVYAPEFRGTAGEVKVRVE